MGMVFQNYAIWPHKNVFENVVFGLKIRKVPAAEARRKVEEALALVNLSGLETRYPSELSGGQQQRVALARSLVVEPDILLLDEPLSNLDAKLRERMRSELKELQRRTGITFVYVTHDQAEALALSDQIAVMNLGRVQQYGTPFEVYAHPANRMVADFMGLVNLVPGKVRGAQWRRRHRRDRAGARGRRSTRSTAFSPGDAVEVAIRPESIRLGAAVRSGRQGDNQQPRLPRQYQRILRHAAVRPDAAGADPSAAAFQGRRALHGRGRRHPLHRLPRRQRRGEGGVVIQGVDRMNKPMTTPIRGEEHWTNKGDDVRLFLWKKSPIRPVRRGTILFVHGSSMASTPTFDLQVPGRSDSSAMDYFAARGFDTWCMDMEGYGKLHQDPRQQRADLLRRRRLLRRRHLHPEAARRRSRCWSTGYRRARCAPRCSRSGIRRWCGGSRSTPMCGPAKARRRSPSAASGSPNSAPRIGGRSTAPSCIRSSTATIPAPPTTM